MPFFHLTAIAITIILSFLFSMMSQSIKSTKEKKTQFECGFNKITKNKSSFSTQFFLIMILFLVFDLEVAILIPMGISESISKSAWALALIFILVITLAMTMEWANGMLEWTK